MDESLKKRIKENSKDFKMSWSKYQDIAGIEDVCLGFLLEGKEADINLFDSAIRILQEKNEKLLFENLENYNKMVFSWVVTSYLFRQVKDKTLIKKLLKFIDRQEYPAITKIRKLDSKEWKYTVQCIYGPIDVIIHRRQFNILPNCFRTKDEKEKFLRLLIFSGYYKNFKNIYKYIIENVDEFPILKDIFNGKYTLDDLVCGIDGIGGKIKHTN